MRPRKILFFSRSVLFEHSVVRRQGDELSWAEQAFVKLARLINCEVECTKSGRVFESDLDTYAAIVSYACGRPTDLMQPESLDGSPPLTERGWKNLDAAVRGGKAYVAIHPGIWLLPEAVGADCLGHGSQQEARIKVVSPQFPGVEKLGESFSMVEEWFSLMRFAKDLHVVLVQDCAGMKKDTPGRPSLLRSPPVSRPRGLGCTTRDVCSTRPWAIARTCGRARSSSRFCWAGCRGRWAGWRPTSRPTSTRSLRRPNEFMKHETALTGDPDMTKPATHSRRSKAPHRPQQRLTRRDWLKKTWPRPA